MKIGFWNFYNSLNLLLFVSRNAPIGDDLLLPFMRLHEIAAARGIECVVLSKETLPALDAVVFIDFPDIHEPIVAAAFASDVPRYLLVFEPPTVRPENQSEAVRFQRVFTWSDSHVAFSDRYVKLNYASEFPAQLPSAEPRKLLTMIASAKRSSHPQELYHRRVEVVEFFDRFADEPRYQFDLYGPGWNGHPTWRGVFLPGQKRATLSRYRFSVVFENGRFPGYITEKLFDCFIAGTVPIYCGAPNVRDHVPEACFIDMDRFGDTWTRVGRMADFLLGMPAERYALHRAAIGAFIMSDSAEKFTTARFAKTILDTIEGDLTVV